MSLRNRNWLILLLIGISLRIIFWQDYPFSFDQVQIMEAADQIVSGKLTLIGPKSGPIQFFTGPLVYYLMAVIKILVSTPASLMLAALFISVATGCFLIWANENYLSQKNQVIPWLWAVSPLIVQFDRGFWNPNLTLLASSLVFFPLIKLLKSKNTSPNLWKISCFLVAVGSWLGYQAHFSGLLLPVVVGLVLLFTKKLNVRNSWILISAMLGTAFSLLPTLIFDLRHDWLNIRGLMTLGSQGLPTIGESLLFIPELFGKIVVGQFNRFLSLLVGSLILISIFYHYQKNKTEISLLKISFIWLLSISLLLSFYNSTKPEYYYFIQLPAALVILGEFLSAKLNVGLRFKLIAILGLLSFWQIYSLHQISALGIYQQYQIAEQASNISQSEKIRSIDYEYPDAEIIGVKYWLSKFKIELDENSEKRVVISPTDPRVRIDEAKK